MMRKNCLEADVFISECKIGSEEEITTGIQVWREEGLSHGKPSGVLHTGLAVWTDDELGMSAKESKRF